MVAESLLASGQPIPRQRKVFVVSCDSLLSFCAILEASVEVTRCIGSLSICTPSLGR